MQSDKARAGLAALATIGREPQAVLAALGPRRVSSTRERFREGVDPKGIRWDSYAPLNPLYAEDKRGPSILIGAGGMASGLMLSITSQVEGNVLMIGSSRRYAAVHQFGAVIRPKNAKALVFTMGGRTFRVASVTVPARPYLGLSTDDREMIVEEIALFVGRAIGRYFNRALKV